jgi:hypothetical protein
MTTPPVPLSAESPRHVLWLARLRVAWRRWWLPDGAALVLAGVARVETVLILPHGYEANPLNAAILRVVGIAPTVALTWLAVAVILLAFQTYSVAQGRLGRVVGTASAWTLLALAALDAAFDGLQLLAAR